jgi:hypothetical protein
MGRGKRRTLVTRAAPTAILALSDERGGRRIPDGLAASLQAEHLDLSLSVNFSLPTDLAGYDALVEDVASLQDSGSCDETFVQSAVLPLWRGAEENPNAPEEMWQRVDALPAEDAPARTLRYLVWLNDEVLAPLFSDAALPPLQIHADLRGYRQAMRKLFNQIDRVYWEGTNADREDVMLRQRREVVGNACRAVRLLLLMHLRLAQRPLPEHMNIDRAPGLCRAAARAIGCAFADACELDKTSVDALDRLAA